ncbi:MAG: hypothetical protein KBT20_07050 [Bacteroidales bacterium]|nr:hypothetical protein [Candidatus Liminaster caballi]
MIYKIPHIQNERERIVGEMMALIELVSKIHIGEEIIFTNDSAQNGLLISLIRILKESSYSNIVCDDLSKLSDFYIVDLKSESSNITVSNIVKSLIDTNGVPKNLNIPLGYLFDELVCNMQQHSGVQEGHIYASVNKGRNTIDLCFADYGITIYGSYINTGKFLDFIGTSHAEAVNIAKEGYSTKNRPDAENRGYGISSNTKMVVDGLNGSFAIISGTGLFHYHKSTGQNVIEMPDGFEWQGTTIIVRIPLEIPSTFNFYDYIS